MAAALRFMALMQRSRSKLIGAALSVAGVAVLSVPAWTDRLSYFLVSKIVMLGVVFVVLGAALLSKGR